MSRQFQIHLDRIKAGYDIIFRNFNKMRTEIQLDWFELGIINSPEFRISMQIKHPFYTDLRTVLRIRIQIRICWIRRFGLPGSRSAKICGSTYPDPRAKISTKSCKKNIFYSQDPNLNYQKREIIKIS